MITSPEQALAFTAVVGGIMLVIGVATGSYRVLSKKTSDTLIAVGTMVFLAALAALWLTR